MSNIFQRWALKYSKLRVDETRIWCDDVKNPFCKRRTVKVLDIQNGWVKYSSQWGDDSMEITSFLFCYKRIVGGDS